MKNYRLKRFSQTTLKKVLKEENNIDVYLLRYLDFELFDKFMLNYETIHPYLDNSKNSEEDLLTFIDRRKNKIRKYHEINLNGFYNRVIDISEINVDKYVRRSNMKVIVDNKEVIDVGIYFMFGYIGMELLEEEYLDLFEEIADKLAREIGLNIYEPHTKHEEIPLKTYFKKEA